MKGILNYISKNNYIDSKISGKLDKTGGNITGDLNVTGNVTAPTFNGTATKVSNKLNLSINGESKVQFDGSSEENLNLNITPESIGTVSIKDIVNDNILYMDQIYSNKVGSYILVALQTDNSTILKSGIIDSQSIYFTVMSGETLEPGVYTLQMGTFGSWIYPHTEEAVDPSLYAAMPILYTLSSSGARENIVYVNMNQESANVNIEVAGVYYLGLYLYGDGTRNPQACVYDIKLEKGPNKTKYSLPIYSKSSHPIRGTVDTALQLTETSVASGKYSVVAGNICEASGEASFAVGIQTIASGPASHAEGNLTTASWSVSHAEGYLTTASGDTSHAEGYKTTASGSYSHAEGRQTTALGSFSHAEGGNTTASKIYSHAEGCSTTASGSYSHAEGYYTKASGDVSHAEGCITTASGSFSHAGGYYTQASQKCGYVFGCYNVIDGNEGSGNGYYPYLIIGNGTSSSSRSNCFKVYGNGKVHTCAGGSYNTTGADYGEYFEWLDSNPNSEDRIGYFVTSEGKNIKIAKSDDYILGVISGISSVIGNSDETYVHKYKTDKFGRVLKKTENIKQEDGSITEISYPIENENYNPDMKYIHRSERPEWDVVGMLGVVIVRDDGTCKVNGFCKCNDNGVATKSESGYRVIERIDENIIRIVLK